MTTPLLAAIQALGDVVALEGGGDVEMVLPRAPFHRLVAEVMSRRMFAFSEYGPDTPVLEVSAASGVFRIKEQT